ncbi:MAG TPA: S8 family serine peptidase [Pyrinomonadaceae bacterium]
MLSKISRFRLILMLLIVAGCAVALLRSGPTTATATSSAQVVPVIVEFRDDPAAVYKARVERSGGQVTTEALEQYRKQLSAAQADFLKQLAAQGIQFAVKGHDIKNFDGTQAAHVELRYTLVYNGMTLSVPSSAIPSISAMPQVKRVHPDAQLRTMLNKSVDYIHAPAVYGKSQELSQFDDLREGYEGQGMYVSIIDSGVDWTHPMFGGDPVPPRLAVAPVSDAVPTNKKVVYYLPLTDSGIEDGFGHGTHVASTVAGYLAQAPGPDGLPNTADDIRLHGVAPQAKIMSYKVCSDIKSTVSQVQPVGGCASSDTIMALEDSVSPFTLTGFPKPVAHVINMSLGGSGGPDNPTAVAASNASLAGTTVVAASGNSGPGEGTTGSPAAGTHVISVGANTHPGSGSLWSADLLQASAVGQNTTGAVTPANNFPAANGFSRLKMFPMSGSVGLPSGAIAQRYVFVNLPVGPWPASVSGRIALVKDALGATIFDICAQASAAGAVGIILFDDRGTLTAVKTTIPAASISSADGEVLVDALSSTDNNNVDPPNGAISELPVRMNPFLTAGFMGEMAEFSSRGPVQGLGQIKPDVSAPGVAVLAAVPPASVLGALATALEGTPNYFHSDGTSMATPHTTGAAALIKQAHLDWTPDVIRTVLINTATNMRNEAGAPKQDGPSTADSIIAQGGGLIDVKEAVNAKALMGVAGDGIEKPAILGSHSFGEVPVVNSRTTHTSPVTVTVRDLSGEGGTYNLDVANNRDLQLAGISVSLSQPSVTLQPNGTATFTVNATVDGDKVRDVMAAKTGGSEAVFEKIQMQWYVTARRSDNAESLRMPFYFKPGPSLPANTVTETITQTGTVPVGDQGLKLASGVTYVDVPFEVSSSVIKLEATTEWFARPTGSQEDIDYELLDPEGNVVASSGGPAGASEFVSLYVTRPGTYTHRIVGFQNAATDFTVMTTFTKASAPPVLAPVAGEFTDAQARAVDFDGSYTVQWQATGGELGFEVERSTDGTNYTVVASPAGNQTSLALADQPNGQYTYRVRSLVAGRIGKYVTSPSNTATIVVDRRGQVDITSQIEKAISNVSFTGGVFKLDLNFKNLSTAEYVPVVEAGVVSISSTSGTVSVKNADNGGDGKSAATAALFGYSNLLGADQVFSPAETTGNRTLQFNDPAAEMFNFDVRVTAFQKGADGTAAPVGGGAAPNTGGTAGSGGSGTSLQSLTRVLRFTANPLTRTVTAKLL